MRKVQLTVNQDKIYQLVKRCVEENGNRQRLALQLGCTDRTVRRYVNGYKQHGKAFFVHRNQGRQPATTIDSALRQFIISLYKDHYHDASFTHFHDLLEANYPELDIPSLSCIRHWMKQEKILSPYAFKATVRAHHKALQESPKPLEQPLSLLEAPLRESSQPHPRQSKSPHPGELIQMDASKHVWFGNEYSHLHLAIDYATGTLVGAYFCKEETLQGYYQVLAQILRGYGIPFRLLTDARTIFTYFNKLMKPQQVNPGTQFSYACKTLGIDLAITSIPQAKGQIERSFSTLQKRLVVELRLAGVQTIEQANAFLDSYIIKHNAQFASCFDYTKSVFAPPPSDEEINLILAVLQKRKVDSGHAIKLDKTFYLFEDERANPVYPSPKQDVLVIKAFDGTLYARINDRLLRIVPTRVNPKHVSNFEEPTKPAKQDYFPPFFHPWKTGQYEKHALKWQHSLEGYTFDDLASTQANLTW